MCLVLFFKSHARAFCCGGPVAHRSPIALSGNKRGGAWPLYRKEPISVSLEMKVYSKRRDAGLPAASGCLPSVAYESGSNHSRSIERRLKWGAIRRRPIVEPSLRQTRLAEGVDETLHDLWRPEPVLSIFGT